MSERKPFNLERALAGDPVVTRDGNTVVWISYCEKLKTIVALLSGHGSFIYTTASGRVFNSTPSSFDLFMAPKTRTVKIFVYRHEGHIISATEDQVEYYSELTAIVTRNDILKEIEVEVEV